MVTLLTCQPKSCTFMCRRWQKPTFVTSLKTFNVVAVFKRAFTEAFLPSFLSFLSVFLKQFQDRNETISSLLLYSSHGANLISPEGVSITDSGIQALTATHSLIIQCIMWRKKKKKTNKITGPAFGEPTAFEAGSPYATGTSLWHKLAIV